MYPEFGPLLRVFVTCMSHFSIPKSFASGDGLNGARQTFQVERGNEDCKVASRGGVNPWLELSEDQQKDYIAVKELYVVEQGTLQEIVKWSAAA